MNRPVTELIDVFDQVGDLRSSAQGEKLMALASEVDRPSADLTLRVSDLPGQHTVDVTVSEEATFGELLESLRPALDLPVLDAEGLPLNWSLLHQGESRRVLPGEVVGEACRPGDSLQVVPDISAGGG